MLFCRLLFCNVPATNKKKCESEKHCVDYCVLVHDEKDKGEIGERRRVSEGEREREREREERGRERKRERECKRGEGIERGREMTFHCG